MNVLDWKDIAIVLLGILGYFLKEKNTAFQEKLKGLEQNLQKFKSAYYVKMELRASESVEKFEKVYKEISTSTADILDRMNADKIEMLGKINDLSLQLKNK